MHKFKVMNSFKLIKFMSLFIFVFGQLNTSKVIFANTENINSVDSINKNIQNDFYLLGPGDIISIDFLGADELSGEFQILNDGNIQLPLIGSKSLSGLSLNQAKEKLISLFNDELIRPELNLKLLKPRPLKISVIGEIYRPGLYSLNLEGNSVFEGSSLSSMNSGYPTVVDAIQKSGGLTFDADITNIVLYREILGEKGQYKKVKLNLLSMFQTGAQINNPNLFDGDIIKISKLADNKNSLERIPNNLIPDRINIYVVGEVERPGMYTVDLKTTVNNAILIAGGPVTLRYQKNNINLIRVKRNGQVENRKLSFNETNLPVGNKKSPLRNGDIIRVNKNLFGKSTDVLGTILGPVQNLYSLYGVYSLIND